MKSGENHHHETKSNHDNTTPTNETTKSFTVPGNQTSDSTIELEPFIHQVGGRSTILVLGKYICKPINERELSFYESIDQYAPLLKPFVAQYNGTISVNFEESDDGYLVITTKSRVLTPCDPNYNNNINKNNNNINNNDNNNETPPCIDSSDSPYQKFVTKYRIKLVRPIKEIIIESHEEDKPVHFDLEAADRQLNDILNNRENNDRFDSSSSSSSLNHNSTNLNRSRSTSISIPNFEDGNCNQSDLSTLFDNQLFINEVGQNGFQRDNKRKISQQENVQTTTTTVTTVASPSSPKVVYNLSTTKHNPWVLKTFSVLSEFNESMKEQKFILLENLTSNFEYPCIMDLKMGTRLHDDMASQTKIQSHESKVNETTSGVLGLRVTGIQIYDKNLDKFICYNKYYGRKLTPETFRSTLKMFISNENFRCHKLLDRMIERLKQLRLVIVELDSFRFYTSSLLLIYEGNACNTCLCKQTRESPSLADIPQPISTTTPTCFNDCEICKKDPDELFDVRVIDFAHSTHANLKHSTMNSGSPITFHKGYDEGFVFGLDNLIKILTLFRDE